MACAAPQSGPHGRGRRSMHGEKGRALAPCGAPGKLGDDIVIFAGHARAHVENNAARALCSGGGDPPCVVAWPDDFCHARRAARSRAWGVQSGLGCLEVLVLLPAWSHDHSLAAQARA